MHAIPDSTTEPLGPPLCAIFRRSLKRQGLKFTPERARILDAVLARTGVFEADELHAEMRAAGHGVSQATIYRTLKHLILANIVSEVLIDSRQARYQLAIGRHATNHLVCVETNEIIEFTCPELQDLIARISRAHGFEPVSHRFVVFGVRPDREEP